MWLLDFPNNDRNIYPDPNAGQLRAFKIAKAQVAALMEICELLTVPQQREIRALCDFGVFRHLRPAGMEDDGA